MSRRPSGAEDHGHEAPKLTLEETAVDACSRKRHAVSRGYFADPYLKYFAADSTYMNVPLMNRGYWLRVRAFESGINRFVESIPADSPFQVVSLGGGYDTMFFRWLGLASGADPEVAAGTPLPGDSEATAHEIRDFALSPESSAGRAIRAGRLRRFVEIDQSEVVAGKRRVIREHEDLATLAALKSGEPITAVPTAASVNPAAADVLRLVGADLRQARDVVAALTAEAPPVSGMAAHEVKIFDEAPSSGLLDASVPTLFIAECVLVYMRPAESHALLEAIAGAFSGSPCLNVLSYDAIRPHTPFGKQMLHTLGQRGLELRGIMDLPDTAAHEKRYAALGFAPVTVWTMKQLFEAVPRPVQQRLNHVEILDDYDEWVLVHEHYCISSAWHGTATPAAIPKLFF